MNGEGHVDEFDDLMKQFEALTPGQRRADIERCGRYLQTQEGRRAFGLDEETGEFLKKDIPEGSLPSLRETTKWRNASATIFDEHSRLQALKILIADLTTRVERLEKEAQNKQ